MYLLNIGGPENPTPDPNNIKKLVIGIKLLLGLDVTSTISPFERIALQLDSEENLKRFAEEWYFGDGERTLIKNLYDYLESILPRTTDIISFVNRLFDSLRIAITKIYGKYENDLSRFDEMVSDLYADFVQRIDIYAFGLTMQQFLHAYMSYCYRYNYDLYEQFQRYATALENLFMKMVNLNLQTQTFDPQQLLNEYLQIMRIR